MLKQKADYKNIESEFKRFFEKRTKERAKREKEFLEQKQKKEMAEARKKAALEVGTKEDYLKVCLELEKENAALEFLKGKVEQSKRENKISLEELINYKKRITEEQDSVTIIFLKQIQNITDDLLDLCNEVIEEQNRGGQLYSEILELFKADATPEEIDNASRIQGLLSTDYLMIYGVNFVYKIINELEKFTKVVNSQATKNFIEGKR